MIEAKERYREKVRSLSEELDRLSAQFVTYTLVRTVLFFGALALLIAGYNGAQPRGLWLSLGWSLAGVFLLAMFRHEALKDFEAEQKRTRRFYRRLLARCERNWSELPAPTLPANSVRDPRWNRFGDDLDVHGIGGLWQWYALVGTYSGRRTLTDWFVEVPTWDVVQERQRAVALLRDQIEWRELMQRMLYTEVPLETNDDSFPKWAEEPSWLPNHWLARWLSWVGPFLVVFGLGVWLVGSQTDEEHWKDYGGWIGLAGIGLNFLVTILWGSIVHDIFARISGPQQSIERLSKVVEMSRSLPKDEGLLDRVAADLVTGEVSAAVGLPKLTRWVRWSNYHRIPLTYPLYLLLQFLWMWDFRVLEGLERWKDRFGGGPIPAGPTAEKMDSPVRRWFDALGTLESLLSGGTVADEHRAWGFPQPLPDTPLPNSETMGEASRQQHFIAKDLGHPLLPDEKRIVNDVQIAADQPLLLVTGSNMAGKSTLLRTLGLNLLLARAGSPVCASEMRTHLYELATSIRIQDSLRDGVSLFMAELLRLKQVVDACECQRSGNASPPFAPVFFLLDEILQGTNSRERQIAVVTVLERVLRAGAVGAISTHDLDLAAHEAFTKISQVVHFREHFVTQNGEDLMRFDYRMYSGPTPTTNALKLLRLVGLD
jgi:energy-coupling factor transporter ATP-binding protein EcfA2